MEDWPDTASIPNLRLILAAGAAYLVARRDLGVALIEEKKYPEASAELQRVAAAAPGDYVTRYELGIANESLGRTNEARDQFEAACALAPAAEQCRQALARLNGAGQGPVTPTVRR